MRFVTADREFIGREWIGWLLEQGLAFRIRVKAGEWLRHADGRERRGSEWFGLQACRCKPRPMTLWGLRVYVGGKRLGGSSNEYLIVISNEKGDLFCEYRLRSDTCGVGESRDPVPGAQGTRLRPGIVPLVSGATFVGLVRPFGTGFVLVFEGGPSAR